MSRTNLFLLLLVFLAGTSCNKQQHFISDDAFRAEVEKDFQAKQAALPNGNLFSRLQPADDTGRKRGAYFLVCLYADRGYYGLRRATVSRQYPQLVSCTGGNALGRQHTGKISSAISYFPCESTTRIWTRAAWSFMKN